MSVARARSIGQRTTHVIFGWAIIVVIKTLILISNSRDCFYSRFTWSIICSQLLFIIVFCSCRVVYDGLSVYRSSFYCVL